MSKNIELLAEYNNSYLYYDPESFKISFEGELEDVAIGLYKRYSEMLYDTYYSNIRIGNSRLIITKISAGNCELFYEYSNAIGDINRPPLFLHILNNEFKKIINKISKLKSFW